MPGGPRAAGPGRRRAPLPRRGPLTDHIAATRQARHAAERPDRRARSALVLLVAGGAWGLTGYVSGHLGRVNAGTARQPTGPLNILLAGVDVRAGLTPAQHACCTSATRPAPTPTR